MEIAQDGSGNIAIQVDGNNNSVTVTRGEARLTLLQRHRRRRKPRRHLDLLDPYSRAIDLVGRDDDLGALEAWLASSRPIAVRCLTGRAGSGKTRLALELCERAENKGWLSGFVAHDELVLFQQRQHLAGWRWPRPTLVVVDYAAASARVLRRWLEQLAEHQGSEECRLRLLLLERHANTEAGWWAELTRFGGFGSGGLEDLLDPLVPVPVPSLRTVEQRRYVLRSVMAAASRLDGIDPALQPPAPGADPRYEARLADDLLDNEPLYLMMAGLTAVQARVPHMVGSGRTDLACQLATAEIERIGRLARDRVVDGAFLQHLAACVTLTDGITYDAAEQLVMEEQKALQLPAVDAAGVAAALIDALPTPLGDAVDSIRPDLIGEAAVLATFAIARRTPERQAAIVGRAWRRAPAQTMAAVVRSAQDYAPPNGRHPTLAWLEHLAGLADDSLTLMALADQVPMATTCMRELIAKIQNRIVDFVRVETDEYAPAQLARSLNNLAIRLSDLGRREAALAAAEEAVLIRREFATNRPDTFRADLAGTLSNLANRRSDLSQHSEAFTAAEEAVQLYRELAVAYPDVFRTDLAGTLSNLANRHSELGQHHEALAASEEAVQLHRELAAVRPDAFRPNLAMSLNNLAGCLSDLSRHDEALAAAEEAVQLYRELVGAYPDAFRPNLAASFNNLASLLSDLGRHDEALAAAEEAVQLYRELAATRPDAFRPTFATSLAVVADCLETSERAAAALVANQEAIEVLAPAFLSLPEAFGHGMLSMVQQYIGRCEAQGSEPDAALLEPLMPTLMTMMQRAEDETDKGETT